MNWRNLRRTAVAAPHPDTPTRRRSAATAPMRAAQCARRHGGVARRVGVERTIRIGANMPSALTRNGMSVAQHGGEAGHLRRHEGLLRAGATRVGGVADDADHRAGRAGSTVGRRQDGGRTDRRAIVPERRRTARRGDRPRTARAPSPGRARWRNSSSPRSIGKLSVRSGWSISCDSGSIASSPSTNSTAPCRRRPASCRGTTSLARPPADRGERRHAHQPAAGNRSRLCHAAPPHRVAADARHPDPRTAAGVLVGELATQQDHRAQVLHGDGESQLGHQAAAAGEGVERGAAQHRCPTTIRTTANTGPSRSTGAAASPTAPSCRRCWRGRGCATPMAHACQATTHKADRCGDHSGSRMAWATSAGRPTAARGVPNDCAADGPATACRAVAAGQLADDRADAATSERGAAHPLDGRSQQGARAIDGRQHHVGDVGCLERQRSALAAAAQRREERQRRTSRAPPDRAWRCRRPRR